MLQSPANLLLISFDQWRGDWADPKDPVVHLPALQRLAKHSVVAERCYTSSPQCVPARLSWLTGLAPSQMGVTRNTVAEVPADAPSLFRKLQASGWYTELIGKTHWTNHRDPTDLRQNQSKIRALGFDRVMEIAGPKALRHVRCDLTDMWEQENMMELYIEDMRERYGGGQSNRKAWEVRSSILPNQLYPDIWLAERALEALHRMPSQQPWLLWISFVGPHEPFDTPAPWCNLKPQSTPNPTPQGKWIAELPSNCELKKSQERWQGKLSDDEVSACRQDYANNLQLLDAQLQRLLDALAKRNDADLTAIATTSDHGEMLGDHGMLYKGTFLESSIRVPFQYCPPPRCNYPAQSLHRPVALTALFSTMLNSLTEGGDAKDILQTAEKTNHVCVEFGDELLIIQNNRKLCRKLNGEILWATNLRTDPKEQLNQLKIHPRLLSQKRGWARTSLISDKELHKRSDPNWQWRNCCL